MGLRLSDLRRLGEPADLLTTHGMGLHNFTLWAQSPGPLYNSSLEVNNGSLGTDPLVAALGIPQQENHHPRDFFDTYFSAPRFALETTLAIIATLGNIFTLIAIMTARCHRSQSVYNKLFINLAVADSLSCCLSWLCNNILLLFRDQVADAYLNFNMCRIFVYLVAGVCVSSAFAILSTVTMLGFTSVQYFGICRPLHHQSIMSTNRVRAFIICSWLTSLLCCFVPFLVAFFLTGYRECSLEILTIISDVVIYTVNCCTAIVGTIYLVILILCLRIYHQIRVVGQRISRFRSERQDVKGERRAFVTIVILICTLTIFYVPYSVIFIVSLNSNGDSVGVQDEGVIYYMTLLPYLKFLSDPLIYGLRMREVKDGCLRMLVRCGLGKCKCIKTEMDSIFHRVPTGNSSFYLQRMNSRSTSVS